MSDVRLHFLGANRQVTGSRYVLQTARQLVMVDCGLFQERPFLDRNWAQCPVSPQQLRAVVITHVHIDHIGWLPRLVQQGFRGPVYATEASVALARIMLMDAAKIQMEDAAYKKKRHQREGRQGPHPEVPLYTDEDVEATLPLFHAVPYQQPFSIGDDLRVELSDAGHVLGSAIVQCTVDTGNGDLRVVFSGDLGQTGKPLLRDPTLIEGGDYVIVESTYGDRNHEPIGPVADQLGEVIRRTVARGGKIVIPTFALERTQELLYHLSGLVHNDAIPSVPVFVDSPMAADITEVFRRFAHCFDEETWQRLADQQPPWHFEGLRFARTVEESKQINGIRQPCIIMSTSGMCTEGRIKHHLRATIEDERNAIVFVGFQAQGTLGRRIVDGEPLVRIHGENYRVRAEVVQINGFSGHADQRGLLAWLAAFRRAPRRVFLTHGEESASATFAQLIHERFGWSVSIPRYLDQTRLA